VLLSFPDSHHS